MVVQHNISAMNANRYFGINNSGLSKSLEKLSSGFAINRAGDNAAGLAVSEKMRSQIAGLTQGVKNAEDGISMIQTYEGALTETDNILQRMKTLATQAANGTYQNDVDREAIQLEFNQLNDELDQIADTDFNGVVALNGGQMADGTKAVNGEFGYASGNRVATELGKQNVNAIDGSKWNTGTVADTAWKALNASWIRTAGQDSTMGPESVDVTFKYDATANTWTTVGATNGADKTKVTATQTTAGSKDGGFEVKINNVSVADVVMDTSNLVSGDTITLTFNNPSTGVNASSKGVVTLTDGGDTFIEGTNTNAQKLTAADDVTVAIGATASDVTKITDDVNALLEKLNNAQVSVAYDATNATTAESLTLKFSDEESYNGKTDAQTMTVGSTTFHLTFADGSIKIGTAEGGAEIATITTVKQAACANGDGSSGTLTFDLAIEHNEYEKGNTPSVEIKSNGKVSLSNSNNAATASLTYTDNLTLQVGARTKDSVNFTFEYASKGIGELEANLNCSSRTDGLGTKDLSLLTQEDANYAIDRIDNAINKVSMVRATFGAVQNRLEHKIDNMNVTKENITSAESRIRDTDMAAEMTNFTKNQILSQASQAMLAQANQLPQGVLQLLG